MYLVINPAPVLAALLVLVLAACSGQVTPEDRVRAWLEAGELAAEKRQLRVLRGMISSRYEDRKGRDRRALVRLLAAYFHRHRSVYLLTRIETIDLPGPDRAEVVLYAAMAGTPIDGVQSLADIRADLHRFELHLAEEEGDWKLVEAAWGRASPKDFLPLGDT